MWHHRSTQWKVYEVKNNMLIYKNSAFDPRSRLSVWSLHAFLHYINILSWNPQCFRGHLLPREVNHHLSGLELMFIGYAASIYPHC